MSNPKLYDSDKNYSDYSIFSDIGENERILLVKNFLTNILANNSDIRFLKGIKNLPIRKEKYIGLCGTSSKSTTLSLTNSEENSLFTISPIKKYNNQLDSLRNLINGTDSFRIFKSTNNQHSGSGEIVSISTDYSNCQTPVIILSDVNVILQKNFYDSVSDSKKLVQDTSLFVFDITRDDNSDIDLLIFKVFSGQADVKIKKSSTYHTPLGDYLGFCHSLTGTTLCNAPVLALSNNIDNCIFRIHSLDLLNAACCLKKTTFDNNHVVCGTYYDNPITCDKIVSKFCKIFKDSSIKLPVCSCISSNIEKPQCFDNTCKKYGYKNSIIKNDKCSVNNSICYNLKFQDISNNHDLDRNEYIRACGNYTDSNYISYVFKRYFIPIIIFFILSLFTLGLFKVDYDNNNQKKK